MCVDVWDCRLSVKEGSSSVQQLNGSGEEVVSKSCAV